MKSLLSRRDFLAAASAATLSPCWAHADDEPPLRVRASKKGLYYGCALHAEQLADEPFRDALIREANIVVHEGALKWEWVHPEEDRYDFSAANSLVEFAAKNDMKVRGHTLLWYAVNPPWVEARLASNPSERVFTDHIEKVAGYYRGRIHSWDVVNEALEPAEGHPDGLRIKSNPWFKAFGPSHIETAFYAARQADPNAMLFYNDYAVEAATSDNLRKRVALLRLCERLRAKRVPIDAVGIQGHLKAFREPFDERIFARFLADIRSLGLKVMVTEFDVADIGGPTDIVKRDAEVASLTRRFMDVLFDNPNTIGMLTWGLSDRYSWLSHPIWGADYRWPDGQLSRGLPLDGDLNRKPMWHAIAHSISSRPAMGRNELTPPNRRD